MTLNPIHDPAVIAAAKILAAHVGTLCTRDQQFAQSLLASFANGRCSPGQRAWILRMCDRAAPGARTSQYVPAARTATAAPVVTAGVGVARLHRLFQRAKAALKKPRITINLTGDDGVGVRLTFKLSTPKSKNPDHIYVYLHDGSVSAYAGKITPAGEWHPVYPAVTPAITAFDRDPAAAASAHGKLTGSCCFCQLPLTDARSVTVGYGQVCAGHYGLPWGNKAGAPDADALFAPVAAGVASVPAPAPQPVQPVAPTPVSEPPVVVVQPLAAPAPQPASTSTSAPTLSAGMIAAQLRAFGRMAAAMRKARVAPYADPVEQQHWLAGYDAVKVR